MDYYSSVKNSTDVIEVENFVSCGSVDDGSINDKPILCRICLLKSNELNNLFDQIRTVSDTLTYYDQLTICIPSIIITCTDPYPNVICNGCCQRLDQVYEFHQLAIRSDEILRQSTGFEVDVKIEALKDEPGDGDFIHPVPIDDKNGMELKPFKYDPDYVAEKFQIESKKDRTRTKRKKSLKPKGIRRNPKLYDENGKYIRKKRIPKYKCDICGKMKIRLSELEDHLRSHTGERPFTCEICGKSFLAQATIKKHLESHDINRVKRFKCQLCPYRAIHMEQIRRHEVTHTGDQPFQCSLCGSRFKTKNYLKIHFKRFHTEPTISCEFCKEKFRTHARLKLHIVRHYRPIQYQCPECKNVYAYHKGLILHMKQCHPGIQWPKKSDSCITNADLLSN